MMKRHSTKFLAVTVGVILTLPCGTFFGSVFTSPNAYAKQNSTTAETEQIKGVLLRPSGWLAEWRGNSSGMSDYLFEDRGGKVVVKIDTPAWNMSCERDVTITSDAIKYDACYDANISLYFDPNDQEYPFKGESPNVKYKLKAR